MLRYCVFLLCVATNLSYGVEFWNVDSYYEKYPRKTSLAKSFHSAVQQTAIPMKTRQSKAINISAILPRIMEEEDRTHFLHYFKQRMLSLQIDYRLDIFEYSSEVADDVLFKQYKRVMRSPPDYLITTLDRYQQKSIVESILRKYDTHIVLYDVSSPVVGWENQSSVFYTGVNYQSISKVLSVMVGKALASRMEVIPIVFSNGFRNQQFCNSFLDMFSENEVNMKQVFYFDGSVLSEQRILEKLNAVIGNALIFQCDNFLSESFFKSIDTKQLRQFTINYWLSEGKNFDNKDLQMLKFHMPFKEIEISIAEMIRYHLERKKVPNLYVVDLFVENS